MKYTPYELLEILTDGLAKQREGVVRKLLVAATKNEPVDEYMSAIRGLHRFEIDFIHHALDVYKKVGVMLLSDVPNGDKHV